MIEKLPLIEICGNFNCGNDQLKLNALFILPNAFETVVFALSIFEENADFIPSSMEDAVDFALDNFDENADFMLSSFPPVNVFACDMREFIVSFTPVKDADTIPLIPPPAFVYAVFILFNFVETFDFAVSMREVALSLILVKSDDHFVLISETDRKSVV